MVGSRGRGSQDGGTLNNIRMPVKPIFGMSVHKVFRVHERVKLEYRFETFGSFHTVLEGAKRRKPKYRDFMPPLRQPLGDRTSSFCNEAYPV